MSVNCLLTVWSAVNLIELAKLKAEMQEDYNARLADNEKEMDEMRKTFEEKLKEAQLAGVRIKGMVVPERTLQHLILAFLFVYEFLVWQYECE